MSSRGERLQSAMAARGIRKQIVLATELGVNESAISRWQQGAGLSLEHAVRLCEALDISLDWLLLGRGHMDQHRSSVDEPLRQAAIETIESLQDSVVKTLAALSDSLKIELSTPMPARNGRGL
jgi:transcriptional regulator with XRE-family HTH domain